MLYCEEVAYDLICHLIPLYGLPRASLHAPLLPILSCLCRNRRF